MARKPYPMAPAVLNRWWEAPLDRLREAAVVCVDLETSGLDWRHNHVVGWVLTFGPEPTDSYYLPVRHAAGGNILDYPGPQTATGWDGKPHPIEESIIASLDQPGKLVFGHHLGFDLKFMWRLGMRKFDAWFEDTEVNAALLNENAGRFNLEWCCQEAGVQHKKSQLIKDHIRQQFPDVKEGQEMANYWRLSGKDYVAAEYAEGDGTSTWQLRDWQWPHLGAQDLNRVHDIECRLLPVLVRMSCFGIKVDEQRVHDTIADIDSGRLEAELGFPSGFNSKSPKQVEAWLREQGVTDWGWTATGKPQFNEAYLSTFPVGEKIVTLRRSRTLKDSFMVPMLEIHIWNGRVHTTFNQTKLDDYGTVTGRLSCSDPNLQQASARDPIIGRLHRSCFVPDEGKIWGTADFAQCEPVLLAYYSRAKVLVDGFCKDPPEDAHSAVTRACNPQWNAMSDEEFDGTIRKTKEFKKARDIGKRINQTLITGGGKGVLTSKYGIPPPEVERVWAQYFRKLPEIKHFQRRSSKEMFNKGYVTSLLGRRARLEGWPEHRSKAYTAVNRKLQCGNADIIKLKMVEIDDYLKSEGRPMEMLNSVHDSLDFQFDEGARNHYYQCLNIMMDFGDAAEIKLDIPLRVDYDEGKDWGEAKFGAEK